jgi:hypothetical protein
MSIVAASSTARVLSRFLVCAAARREEALE